MKYLIIFLESFIIILFIDIKYKNSTTYTYLQLNNEQYSPQYSIDVVNHKILILTNMKEEVKSKIWKNSFIQEEVLYYFPNMQIMQEVYNDRVLDDGLFKKRFSKYMTKLQSHYIAGKIDAEEFKKSFLNPPF